MSALEDGRPPIAKFVKPGKNPHWVVVNGVYGNGDSPDDFYIKDPGKSSRYRISDLIDEGYSGAEVALYRRR